MRRHLIIGIAGLGLAIAMVATFWPRLPTTPPTPEDAGRAEKPPTPAEPPAPEPAPPSALAMTGRVLDSDLRPLAGLEVACGEETTVSGAEGAFEFPAARRPGRRPLSVRREGKELIRWDGIITGEVAPEDDPQGAAGEWSGAGSGLRPEMIRWTITLGPTGPRAAPPSDPSKAAPPEPPGKSFIEVAAALIEEWGPTGEARVTGVTSLPDGAHLQVALYLEDERVLSSMEDATAAGGGFRAHIQFPDDFRIHPAAYDLHLIFAVSQEDPLESEAWKQKVPDLPDELEVVRKVFAGTPAEELAENQKIEKHFREVIEAIERLRKILLSNSRKGRMLAARWDPQVLSAEAELEKSSFAGGLLNASGKFDFDGWRRFLDQGLRPEVFHLLDLHARRRSGKFNNAEVLLEAVLR